MYQNEGKYESSDGIKYEGGYALGKRNGFGRLEFPSGMVYEGEFFDNQPHGRGKMTSKLTGWGYEGNFER